LSGRGIEGRAELIRLREECAQGGNRAVAGLALTNYAASLVEAGHLVEAMDAYCEAAALCSSVGNASMAARLRGFLGVVLFAVGDRVSAEANLRSAIDALEQAEAGAFASKSRAFLALLLRAEGRDAEACEQEDRALSDASPMTRAIVLAAR